jgi:hypothetical protein
MLYPSQASCEHAIAAMPPSTGKAMLRCLRRPVLVWHQ